MPASDFGRFPDWKISRRRSLFRCCAKSMCCVCVCNQVELWQDGCHYWAVCAFFRCSMWGAKEGCWLCKGKDLRPWNVWWYSLLLMHNIFCNIIAGSPRTFVWSWQNIGWTLERGYIQHYVVVALTLLYCLPTVGSVDSNGLSCSTANGFVAIYYSCTVRIDLLLVGIPFHLLGLHPIAVFCKELHKSLVLAMVEDLDLHIVAGELSTYVCIQCKCSAGEWWDTSKQQSFDDAAEDGSRTIEESLTISALLQTEEQV